MISFSNSCNRRTVDLMISKNSLACSTFSFHRYVDSTGAEITFTQAANRFVTTARAIFRPSSKLPHVTNTTRASVTRLIASHL